MQSNKNSIFYGFAGSADKFIRQLSNIPLG